ncbi:rab11 family-interacting protein 4B-like [Sinocyclocheilus anshuiensis]|uniref:rab11 family-interacting protein 4B-like n=1 Tax=Sinocyclocheilus anshuiensis TaxID=1608454 RepID=UPI0007BA33DE|nr:PREDICTED: rab11 family-interacting protein 4B-like [Sinocyclocheilus anshuiensis]
MSIQECPESPMLEDEEGEEGRGVERESDRDSAVNSTLSSEISDGGRTGEKEEGIGLCLPGEKCGQMYNRSETSDHSTRSSASVNEEQFEDYGEGEDGDYNPSSPCPDDEIRINGCSDLGSSVSSSAGQTPRKMRHAGDQMDVFCSQCCKRVSLLKDLENRLKNLKTNSPNRKISSTAFGRLIFAYILTLLQVSYLDKKVTELENEILMNGDVKSKLKQENIQLVHRIHELEEQLKDQETRAENMMEEELRRHREAYSRLEKDKNTQIELLTNRVHQLEEENGEMAISMIRLKAQTEKLDDERQRMTDKLEDTSLRLKDEMDLYKKMMDKLRQNRNEFQRERNTMQELIEDLRRELEHLQIYKLEAERMGSGRRSPISLSEYSTRTRESELEQEVKRLKQENQKLREQNEDLNGQLLSLSLHEAKNLFATQTKAQSLAMEIDHASRDQLMEALKEQEEINFRLRQYMDKIILSILDHNPSILEIKN